MSDNHKNTLKTAFNDVTGDTIRTGKGSQEKYADNWDRIFGRKKLPEIGQENINPHPGAQEKLFSEPTVVKALDFHDSVEVSCQDCGGVKRVPTDVLVWDCWGCGSQWPVSESVYA